MTVLAGPTATDLALAKAHHQIPLTEAQALLVAEHYAQRVLTCGEECLSGAEWAVIRGAVCHAAAPNPDLRFLDLVAAMRDRAAFTDDPTGWCDDHEIIGAGRLDRAGDIVEARVDDARHLLTRPTCPPVTAS